MARLEVVQLPVLKDNYVYLVREPATGAVGVVDPAVVEPVIGALRERDWQLTHILNTHHHGDHVGGNLELKRLTGCTIVGPRHDRERIPGIDVEVGDGDTYRFGGAEARVFFVPGHTRGHIAYWFAESDALFCGDTLFALGCGRLFEGTPQQMWSSLSRIRALPEATRVYCAHEYTQANARFALTIEPGNRALAERSKAVDAARAEGRPTVPSTIGEECLSNPFLRPESPEIRRRLGLDHADDTAVFAEVRRRKDNF
ncbi:MAG: hydroxyacylglutathione hydrolase [Alphaproteobacteria bacterium]|nr:hydroxyacylglutathione hydrolase [Alphaproteobacteria bacterium]